MPRQNHLRRLLQANRPSLGTRLQSTWPTITELVGMSQKFDYVEILAEYVPFDLYALENIGRAIDCYDNFSGMIKVPQEMRMHLATRAMSSGIQNLLFSDVRTVDEVRECVCAVRAESPSTGGLRGVGQGRDVGIVLDVGSPAYVQSTADAVIALMIEKREAIENLEALLSVPGVDMVQFGPADYSMSLGIPGQRTHPAVLEAEKHLIQTALKMGVAPRAEIHDAGGAEKYLALGVRHFNVGVDVRVLFNFYRDQGERMRDVFKSLGGEQ